ncbi:hypothetical protein [Blastococcus sp. SYSU DS0617]
MRSIRKAAAAVLLSATMVAAGGSAALAAPPTDGIRWNTYGSTSFKPWSTVGICPTGTGFQPGQTLVVQVQTNGSWADVHSFPTATLRGQWCVYVAPPQLASKPGRYTFRALSRVSPSAPLLEAQTTLTFVGDAGSAYITDEVPEFTLTTGKRVVPVEVGLANGQRVDLQRKSGSRWLNVASVTAPRTGDRATVKLPMPAKGGMGTYRVVNRPTAWTSTYVGYPFTVHQTDAVRHRAYLIRARKFIAAYCPKTPIYIDTPTVAGRGPYGTVGLAVWRWTGDDTSGRLTTSIELRSGMSAAQLRSVALHECAHILQYRTFVDGRRDAEVAAAERLYPGTGVEGQADCMSYYLTKDKRYFGYVRGCNRAQLADARRMWRAYGKKYQAADYRWSR